jgi:hypothetical protein
MVPKNNGSAERKTSLLPKIATLNKRGTMVMITNPLATPFKTSIELIVLPAIGIITSTRGIYKRGINASPNIRFKCEPWAEKNIMGAADAMSANGLNHPGITLLSSINPITNAIIVVNRTATTIVFKVRK